MSMSDWPPCRKALEARGWMFGDLPSFGHQFSKPGVGCVIDAGSDGYWCWVGYTAHEIGKLQCKGQKLRPDFVYQPCEDCDLGDDETCYDRGIDGRACQQDLNPTGANERLEAIYVAGCKCE